jgi:drug/metabolite transporter (DMT)-like permease
MALTRTAGHARLMLVLLTFTWGVTWPLMKIALIEIPPFSMRVTTACLGALTLALLTKTQGRSLRIGSAKAWAHIVAAAILNIVGFSLFSAFAQLNATTLRVAILAYTMPIWAAALARPILGERLTPRIGAALMLCAAGLITLIAPLATAGIPTGLLLAVGSGLSWAAGTVYLKWSRIEGDSLAIATWQLIIAAVAIAACLPLFEGSLHLWPASGAALFGVAFTGIVGAGLAYVIWFEVVRTLPATTASLGVLSVPVVGIVASVILLGERPTLADIVGFALILAASACVLLQPGPRAANDN